MSLGSKDDIAFHRLSVGFRSDLKWSLFKNKSEPGLRSRDSWSTFDG